LVAAKAREPNTKARPNTNVFDAVANFMIAPFSFPITSGNG